jgi:hypothetical protein
MPTSLKRNDHVLFALALALVLTGLPACVSSGPSGPGEPVFNGDVSVVERSRAEPPGWVGLEAGRYFGGGAGNVYRFVTARSGLPDLALGLKDVQIQALQDSTHALATQARLALGEAGDRDMVREGASAELDRLLKDAARDVHSRQAKVADIYFEKLSNERPTRALPAEFYKAFVLIQLPREAVGEVVAQVARRLAGSGDARMRRLGQALQKAPPRAPELSH